MQSSPAARNSTETVTQRLRELILDGTLPAGERVTELGLASFLQVSRTPVRLALARLEKEDLVTGMPNRGFRVRRFTIDEIREIIEVRATLQGMAARLVAEKGLSAEQRAVMAECIDAVDELIASRQHDEATFRRFADINLRFHTLILESAGNQALLHATERNPFHSAPLLHILPAENAIGVLVEAQRDHVRLFEAIQAGHGARAEFLMREHALLPLEEAARIFDHINAQAAMRTTLKTG